MLDLSIRSGSYFKKYLLILRVFAVVLKPWLIISSISSGSKIVYDGSLDRTVADDHFYNSVCLFPRLRIPRE
jgi:hypothetical protein